jgi:hypothetical protein
MSKPIEKTALKGGEPQVIDDTNRDAFFTKFNHDKPSDNVFLITAYHYSQFGKEPISRKDIQQIADDVGVTVPERPDMTLNQATRDGKNMFTQTNRGLFKPTVHGEKYLKETYSIVKGNKKKESKENS